MVTAALPVYDAAVFFPHSVPTTTNGHPVTNRYALE
jgi:hypothetical protein